MSDDVGTWPAVLVAGALAVLLVSCGGETTSPPDPTSVGDGTSTTSPPASISQGPPTTAADDNSTEPGPTSSSPAAEYRNISSDVVAALADRGEVHVIVSLEVPSIEESEGRIDAEVRREIAQVQDSVLAELDESDFRTRVRFDAVPALAGTILSEQGLAVLGTHPDVVAVALDLDGGGGGGGG